MTDVQADGGAAGALAVVGAVPGPALDLAAGLVASGDESVVVGSPQDPAPTGELPDGCHRADPWDRESADGLVASLSACGSALPALRAVVFAWAPAVATTPAPLDAMDEATWAQAAEAPIRQCLAFMQGVRRHFAGRPGSLVVLIPTIAMLGPPPGLVAWATASEGQRTMVKSAARNWGGVGLRSYAVAVTPDLLVASGPDGARRLRSGLPPAAFDGPPTMAGVARVVSTLTGPGLGLVTGATVGVDGGQWMVP